MGTIMTLYVVAFSYFSYMVSGVFAQVFVIYIFRFFSTVFSKIVFIPRDVQVLNGQCYNTTVCDHLSRTPRTAAPATIDAAGHQALPQSQTNMHVQSCAPPGGHHSCIKGNERKG
jgi:hypothetical protein